MVDINLDGLFIIDVSHQGKKARCVLNDEKEPIIGTVFIEGRQRLQKYYQEETYPGAAIACDFLERSAKQLLEEDLLRDLG